MTYYCSLSLWETHEGTNVLYFRAQCTIVVILKLLAAVCALAAAMLDLCVPSVGQYMAGLEIFASLANMCVIFVRSMLLTNFHGHS